MWWLHIYSSKSGGNCWETNAQLGIDIQYWSSLVTPHVLLQGCNSLDTIHVFPGVTIFQAEQTDERTEIITRYLEQVSESQIARHRIVCELQNLTRHYMFIQIKYRTLRINN